MAYSKTIILLLASSAASLVLGTDAGNRLDIGDERSFVRMTPKEIQDRFQARAKKLFWDNLAKTNGMEEEKAREVRRLAALATKMEMIKFALEKNSAEVNRTRLVGNNDIVKTLSGIPDSFVRPLIDERVALRTLVDVKKHIDKLWKNLDMESEVSKHTSAGVNHGILTEISGFCYDMLHHLREQTEATFKRQNEILAKIENSDKVLRKVDEIIDDAFKCSQCSSSGKDIPDKERYFTHPLYVGGRTQMDKLITSNVTPKLVEAVEKILN